MTLKEIKKDMELIPFGQKHNYDKKIILIRHGERLDCVKRHWRAFARYPDDPPLSHHGMQQAELVGIRLKDENIKYIYCSPFLRTVQTANEIAKICKLKINIEFGLHESLLINCFQTMPKIRTPEELHDDFRIQAINLNYKSKFEIKYPETHEEVGQRSLAVLKHIDDLHPDSNVVIIGHGLPLVCMAESCCPNKFYSKRLDYCSLTECIRHKDKYSVGAFMDVEHLKNLTIK